MNRWIVCLTCVVVLAGASVCSAQVTGGVEGGINFANVSISGGGISISASNRTGWLIGGFVDVPLAKQVHFQPELLYSSKGATASSDLVGTTGTGHLRLDYLDIPLLVRFDVPMQGSNVVPFVYAGPQIGILLSAKDVFTPTGGTEVTEDIKSDLSSTSWDLAFGGGVRVSRFLVDVRYAIGLSNIFGSNISAAGGTMKNRVFSIMAGYKF